MSVKIEGGGVKGRYLYIVKIEIFHPVLTSSLTPNHANVTEIHPMTSGEGQCGGHTSLGHQAEELHVCYKHLRAENFYFKWARFQHGVLSFYGTATLMVHVP